MTSRRGASRSGRGREPQKRCEKGGGAYHAFRGKETKVAGEKTAYAAASEEASNRTPLPAGMRS